MKKNEPGYSLKSVEQSAPPEGIKEGEWHCYILVRGNKEIKGLRRDTKRAVTEYAKDLVETINNRNGWSSISFSEKTES